MESAPEPGPVTKIIPELSPRSLAELVLLPIVAKHLGQLVESHQRSIDILRQRSEARNGVIFFDVSDLDLEGYNKFIPYLLHPECRYSVSVSASDVRAKVSIGSNPWNPHAVEKNLASLAGKYGRRGKSPGDALSLLSGGVGPPPPRRPENTAPLSA